MDTKPSKTKCSPLPPATRWVATATLSCALLLAACAGNPPTSELAVASQAVNAADTAGGTQYAPVEIRTARDKLAAAERALADKDYDKARQLAQQAEWDARVAERKAQAEKVQRALQDAQQAVEELREETYRGLQ
ncbi:MAG: DUF4398 domain-containing protein [Porticoccaceae bacterium]|nr:DUF4398 domain-containing protein [Porticoccaceae bacterium]